MRHRSSLKIAKTTNAMEIADMTGSHNGAWIAAALKWCRDLGLNNKQVWDEVSQGEWHMDVMLTATRGPLPCGCVRRSDMSLTRNEKCKRKHHEGTEGQVRL